MSKTINAQQILKRSREPWLYDESLTDEERMLWKMKQKCHVCGIDPRFHRDDCEWSSVQLTWGNMDRRMERELFNATPMTLTSSQLDTLIKGKV
jgi:hypothetical protein